MKIAEFLETFDLIRAEEFMSYFNLAPRVLPVVNDILAANGYRQRPDGLWRRAKRITLSDLNMSPAGGSEARTGRGGVPVEYRRRRKIQPQGQPGSIWDAQHQMMMKS